MEGAKKKHRMQGCSSDEQNVEEERFSPGSSASERISSTSLVAQGFSEAMTHLGQEPSHQGGPG